MLSCALGGCGHCLPPRTGYAAWKARAGYWSKEQHPETSEWASGGLPRLSRSGCSSEWLFIVLLQADGEEWWWQTPEAQCLWPCVAVQGMVEADKEMLQEVELELAMLGAEEVYSQCSGNGKVSRGPKPCRAPHSRVQL